MSSKTTRANESQFCVLVPSLLFYCQLADHVLSSFRQWSWAVWKRLGKKIHMFYWVIYLLPFHRYCTFSSLPLPHWINILTLYSVLNIFSSGTTKLSHIKLTNSPWAVGDAGLWTHRVAASQKISFFFFVLRHTWRAQSESESKNHRSKQSDWSQKSEKNCGKGVGSACRSRSHRWSCWSQRNRQTIALWVMLSVGSFASNGRPYSLFPLRSFLHRSWEKLWDQVGYRSFNGQRKRTTVLLPISHFAQTQQRRATLRCWSGCERLGVHGIRSCALKLPFEATSRCWSGWGSKDVHGIDGLAIMQLVKGILRFWSGWERTIVHGVVMCVTLRQPEVTFMSWSGRERMGVIGENLFAVMPPFSAILRCWSGRESRGVHGTWAAVPMLPSMARWRCWRGRRQTICLWILQQLLLRPLLEISRCYVGFKNKIVHGTKEHVVGLQSVATWMCWSGWEQRCPWDEDVCFWTARHGHLELLKWARKNRCSWNNSICAKAAKKGQLEILKWARANGGFWDESVCSFAAKNRDLPMLR